MPLTSAAITATTTTTTTATATTTLTAARTGRAGANQSPFSSCSSSSWSPVSSPSLASSLPSWDSTGGGVGFADLVMGPSTSARHVADPLFTGLSSLHSAPVLGLYDRVTVAPTSVPRPFNRGFRTLITELYFAAWKAHTRRLRARRHRLAVALNGLFFREQARAFRRLRSHAVSQLKRQRTRLGRFVLVFRRTVLAKTMKQWRSASGVNGSRARSAYERALVNVAKRRKTPCAGTKTVAAVHRPPTVNARQRQQRRKAAVQLPAASVGAVAATIDIEHAELPSPFRPKTLMESSSATTSLILSSTLETWATATATEARIQPPPAASAAASTAAEPATKPAVATTTGRTRTVAAAAVSLAETTTTTSSTTTTTTVNGRRQHTAAALYAMCAHLTKLERQTRLRSAWNTMVARRRGWRIVVMWSRRSTAAALRHWKRITVQDAAAVQAVDAHYHARTCRRALAAFVLNAQRRGEARARLERADGHRANFGVRIGLTKLREHRQRVCRQRWAMAVASTHWRLRRVTFAIAALRLHSQEQARSRVKARRAGESRRRHLQLNAFRLWHTQARADHMTRQLVEAASARARGSLLRWTLSRWSGFTRCTVAHRHRLHELHVARRTRVKRAALERLRDAVRLAQQERRAALHHAVALCRRVLHYWRMFGQQRRAKLVRLAAADRWFLQRSSRAALVQLGRHAAWQRSVRQAAGAVVRRREAVEALSVLAVWRDHSRRTAVQAQREAKARDHDRERLLRGGLLRLRCAVRLAFQRKRRMQLASQNHVDAQRRRAVRALLSNARSMRMLAGRAAAVRDKNECRTALVFLRKWRARLRRARALSELHQRTQMRKMWVKWVGVLRRSRAASRAMEVAAQHHERRLRLAALSDLFEFAVRRQRDQRRKDAVGAVGRQVWGLRQRALLAQWGICAAQKRLLRGQRVLALEHWRLRLLRVQMQAWRTHARQSAVAVKVEVMVQRAIVRRQVKALTAWMEGVVYVRRKRAMGPAVLVRWRRAKLRRGLAEWRIACAEARLQREREGAAARHWVHAMLKRGLRQWRWAVYERAVQRAKEEAADVHWAETVQRKCMWAWVAVTVEHAQRLEVLWQSALDAKRRAFQVWWLGVLRSRALRVLDHERVCDKQERVVVSFK